MTNVVIARELEAQTDKVGRWAAALRGGRDRGGERERPRGWLPRDRYSESVLVRQSGKDGDGYRLNVTMEASQPRHRGAPRAPKSPSVTPFAGTPLHLAAAAGNASRVRRLLEAGGDPNARDSVIGTTPLHLAAGYGGSVDVVRLLLDAGADPNAREDLVGGTPLHVAAHWGYLDIARLLVEAGAERRACALGDAGTASQVAASRGHHDVAAFLLAR